MQVDLEGTHRRTRLRVECPLQAWLRTLGGEICGNRLLISAGVHVGTSGKATDTKRTAVRSLELITSGILEFDDIEDTKFLTTLSQRQSG